MSTDKGNSGDMNILMHPLIEEILAIKCTHT